MFLTTAVTQGRGTAGSKPRYGPCRIWYTTTFIAEVVSLLWYCLWLTPTLFCHRGCSVIPSVHCSLLRSFPRSVVPLFVVHYHHHQHHHHHHRHHHHRHRHQHHHHHHPHHLHHHHHHHHHQKNPQI